MPLIRISEESKEVLKHIAEKSGLTMSEIVRQWTEGLKEIIEDGRPYTKLVYMSDRYIDQKGKPTNLVISRLAKHIITSFKIFESEEVKKHE